jgi:hypothetical protein
MHFNHGGIMKTRYTKFSVLILHLVVAGLILSGCAMAAPATQPALSSPKPGQTTSISPTATKESVRMPDLTLDPGDYYFSVDGQPGFVFSRNVAGYKPAQYEPLLGWSQTGGTTFVRIQLDSFGMGYTTTGAVDEAWALQWEQVFDKAKADGIYILPVFSGWFDWNAGTGYSTWGSNPLNQVNGGPVKTPAELFKKDSATQILWMDWMTTLVRRWQGRNNILAWEIFSEVNLASGVSETAGIAFIDSAAAIIRAADPAQRPVTASIADTGTWPNFYRKAAIDFIQIHPYPPSGQLDRTIIAEVRASLARYDRPVLIGESGLSAETPDSTNGQKTVATNALYGVQHALWAAIVSGAMNGRALYWEDGFGIYFPKLGMTWMEKYKSIERPAHNFIGDVDFSGFKPLTTTPSSATWGAAIGDEEMVLGWFRDASCEPPDWNLKPVISGGTVTISVPGNAASWTVDFYNTKTGWPTLSPITVTRQGSTVTVPLPDFQDDIAFKMTPIK